MNPAVNKPREQRNASDYYPTPEPLALAICQRLREVIGAADLVIEPSAGSGAFVRAARETWGSWPFVLAVEPNVMEPLAGADEVARCEWEGADDYFREHILVSEVHFKGRVLILGNPPFSLWESHARLALERLPDGGHLAFLLRASALAGQARVRGLWREYPPAHVWHVAPRPSFTGDGRTDGAEYAVIVWRKGHAGSYAGDWLTWERRAREAA